MYCTLFFIASILYDKVVIEVGGLGTFVQLNDCRVVYSTLKYTLQYTLLHTSFCIHHSPSPPRFRYTPFLDDGSCGLGCLRQSQFTAPSTVKDNDNVRWEHVTCRDSQPKLQIQVQQHINMCINLQLFHKWWM